MNKFKLIEAKIIDMYHFVMIEGKFLDLEQWTRYNNKIYIYANISNFDGAKMESSDVRIYAHSYEDLYDCTNYELFGFESDKSDLRDQLLGTDIYRRYKKECEEKKNHENSIYLINTSEANKRELIVSTPTDCFTICKEKEYGDVIGIWIDGLTSEDGRTLATVNKYMSPVIFKNVWRNYFEAHCNEGASTSDDFTEKSFIQELISYKLKGCDERVAKIIWNAFWNGGKGLQEIEIE